MKYNNLARKLNSRWIWGILIFILALGIRCYKFSDKKDLFLDEYLSITISSYQENPYDSWITGIREDTAKYFGKDLKEIYLLEDNTIAEILKDVKTMRYYTRDAPHTNMYYSLLRFSLFRAESVDAVIMHSFILNLIFFSLSFILFYKIGRRLFANNILVICALIVAFLNPASVGNSIFIRPYQLQEFIFMLFSYIFILNYLKMCHKERIDTWKNMLLLAFVTALTLLSGYFAIFFVAIIFVVLICFSVKLRERDYVFFYGFIPIISYIFVLFVYVGYNYGLTVGRAEESLKKLDIEMLLQNISSSLSGFFSETYQFYWGLPVLLLLAVAVIGVFIFKNKVEVNNEKNHSLPLLVAGCALVWVLIVMYFAPYKVIRYILPALPLISLSIPFVLNYYDSKKQLMFTVAFAVLLLGQTLFVENLYWQDIKVETEYENKENIPLIVSKCEILQQVILIPFYTDNRQIEFSFTKESFVSKIEAYKTVYVIVSSKFPEDYTVPDNYMIKEKSRIDDSLELYRLEQKAE